MCDYSHKNTLGCHRDGPVPPCLSLFNGVCFAKRQQMFVRSLGTRGPSRQLTLQPHILHLFIRELGPLPFCLRSFTLESSNWCLKLGTSPAASEVCSGHVPTPRQPAPRHCCTVLSRSLLVNLLYLFSSISSSLFVKVGVVTKIKQTQF